MGSKRNLLSFMNDESLFSAVRDILNMAEYAVYTHEDYMHRNAIDPFSALFDSAIQNITLQEWLEKEVSRQIQKTLQNKIGDFHQAILGASPGWENLETGSVIDIINRKKMIIAEIKNKYNTTKGNHKTAIYDDLKDQLDGKYNGYLAYYVEIIPQNKKAYDKEFTPSDNRTKKRRPANPHIRVVDGKTFYGIATGDNEALKKLYDVLPLVIAEILGRPLKATPEDQLFTELFKRIY